MLSCAITRRVYDGTRVHAAAVRLPRHAIGIHSTPLLGTENPRAATPTIVASVRPRGEQIRQCGAQTM